MKAVGEDKPTLKRYHRQRHTTNEPRPLTIKAITFNRRDHQPSRPSTAETINCRDHQPPRTSTAETINRRDYQPSRPSTAETVNHRDHQPPRPSTWEVWPRNHWLNLLTQEKHYATCGTEDDEEPSMRWSDGKVNRIWRPSAQAWGFGEKIWSSAASKKWEHVALGGILHW